MDDERRETIDMILDFTGSGAFDTPAMVNELPFPDVLAELDDGTRAFHDEDRGYTVFFKPDGSVMIGWGGRPPRFFTDAEEAVVWLVQASMGVVDPQAERFGRTMTAADDTRA